MELTSQAKPPVLEAYVKQSDLIKVAIFENPSEIQCEVLYLDESLVSSFKVGHRANIKEFLLREGLLIDAPILKHVFLPENPPSTEQIRNSYFRAVEIQEYEDECFAEIFDPSSYLSAVNIFSNYMTYEKFIKSIIGNNLLNDVFCLIPSVYPKDKAQEINKAILQISETINHKETIKWNK